MYELKTKENDSNVVEFIEEVENAKKREDAYKLLDIFTETTGYQARMWGPSIIGLVHIIININLDTKGTHR